MRSIRDFSEARRMARPIVMLTAYDALMARLVGESGADAILVGDSAAMVVHGFPSTVEATLEMMVLHTAAVRRGAGACPIVADMPFGSYRKGRHAAADAAGALIQAGANAVKLEGVDGHEEVIPHLVSGGIPVMGHLGLLPQSVNLLGGYRMQGVSPVAAAKIEADARRLEQLGAFAVVLECVPAALAGAVTRAIDIPTIGIGAGPETSGQILVVTDVLGLDDRFRPRFARRYLDGHAAVLTALRAYVEDVRTVRFPEAQCDPASA
jgi:3-methyl-2-oxobutanoate hydroxymethyltransferase